MVHCDGCFILLALTCSVLFLIWFDVCCLIILLILMLVLVCLDGDFAGLRCLFVFGFTSRLLVFALRVCWLFIRLGIWVVYCLDV